jgi:hypothetical protein
MTTNNTCKKCGCQDSFIPSPAPCPTPAGCPNPQPCSEIFDAQCVRYTGTALSCDNNSIVGPNNTIDEAFTNIISYFCSEIATLKSAKLNKYVQTFTTVFDGETKTILGADLIDCGIFTNEGCTSGTLTSTVVDFTINVYYKDALNVWHAINIKEISNPLGSGVKVDINNTTGDITLTFDITPADPAVDVRVVIIG